MKRKFLSILLALCVALSWLPGVALAAESSSFTDMPSKDNWAYAALIDAVENGLLQGESGKLLPGANLTRAQMAAVLNRAFGAADSTDTSTYTDVSPSAWYARDISKAVRMGTFLGSGTAMYPDRAVTRQEAFVVLARAFKLSKASPSVLNTFTDKAQISDWAAGELAAMVNAGYVSGNGQGLNPQDTITRAEFAQVMHAMVSEYFSKSGSYSEAVSGNLLINGPDIALKNLTVTGDLIIGEGAGNGDVTLDGVVVTGRIVVRGGGVNSIILINKTSVGSILIGKTGDGGVRLRTEEGCHVDMVYVDDGKDQVILAGEFNQVTVQTDTPVVLQDATITGLTISAEKAAVKLDGKTVVSAAEIPKTAAGATLEVGREATVSKVSSAAEYVKISGEGTVKSALVSGSNTAVDTKGTAVTVTNDATGVTQNGAEVKSPESENPPAGGGSGGGGSSSHETEITVFTSEELISAIKNQQYKKIRLGSQTNTEDQSFTIPAGQHLSMASGRQLYVVKNQDDNPTKLIIASAASLTVTDLYLSGKLINSGTFINSSDGRGIAVDSGAVIENNGTFENRNHLGIYESSFINRGTLNIGDGQDAHIILAGADLSNEAGGTINNETTVLGLSSADAEKSYAGKASSITNAGIFNNGSISQPASDAFMNLTEGTLANSGTFINNGFLHLNYAALTQSGGSFANYNSKSLYLVGGSFTVSGGQFINQGYMKVEDEYRSDSAGENRLCQIQISGGTFSDNSDWIEYTAAVYSEGGLAAAETAQGGKTGEAPFGKYKRLDFAADMNISGGKTLDAFDMYWVMNRWDQDNERDVPITLTVKNGGSLNVGQGSTLHIDGGQLIIENGATLTAASGDDEHYDGVIEVWPTGGFESQGTVTSSGAFFVRYTENSSGAFEHSGAISGLPDHVIDVAVVYTSEGLISAAEAENPAFKRIEIKDDSNITLTESLTINANLYIESGSGLIVPYGTALTLSQNYWFNNNGDVTVWGTMTINGEFNNHASLEIGAASGGESATVTGIGTLHNGGTIKIYPTGTLQITGEKYTGTPPVHVGVD